MTQIRPPGIVDDPRSTGEQFLDLLLADEDLLRAEFDAVIAAEWPGPPPEFPHRRVRGDRDRGGKRHHRATATRVPVPGRRPQPDGSARQRSPPGEDQEKTESRKGR